MRLLHPILPTGERNFIRALIIVKTNSAAAQALADLATTTLRTVCEYPVQTRALCNTGDRSVPFGYRSLRSAHDLIESGEVDLVIVPDVTCISRVASQVLRFASTCREFGVRLISLQDRIDTADGFDETILSGALLFPTLVEAQRSRQRRRRLQREGGDA
jgi:hypothetical protein